VPELLYKPLFTVPEAASELERAIFKKDLSNAIAKDIGVYAGRITGSHFYHSAAYGHIAAFLRQIS
jgi:hypothetical protein